MLKTYFKSILCLLLTLFIVESADAQILRRIQNKAQDAVERRVEQRIEQEVDRKIDALAEKAVDDTFDSIFGTDNTGTAVGSGTTRQSERSQRASASLLQRYADISNVTTEDEYRFNVTTTIEMETISNEGKSDGKMNMIFHYNENSTYTGTRVTSEELRGSDSDAMIIYDFKNEVMVMMMEAEKSKFSIAYNWKQAEELYNEAAAADDAAGYTDDTANEDYFPNFERLGTRTISGYKSEGYRSSDEHATIEIWVTNEIASGMDRMFAANKTMPAVGNNLPDDYPSGMIMEMTSIDNETGGKFIMKTTEVNQNANISYKMSEYPVMSFGSDN